MEAIREYIVDYLKNKPYTPKWMILNYVTEQLHEEGTEKMHETIARELRTMAEKKNPDKKLEGIIRGKLVHYRLLGSNTVEDKIEQLKRWYGVISKVIREKKEPRQDELRLLVEIEKILGIESDTKVTPKTKFVMTETGVKEVLEGYKLQANEKFI